jgi:threonine dehydrogenase-like Zn-dependent dehydrogenase
MVRGFELLTESHGELVDRELSVPDRGQVVIAVRMTGICASELYDWIQPPQQMVPVGHPSVRWLPSDPM